MSKSPFLRWNHAHPRPRLKGLSWAVLALGAMGCATGNQAQPAADAPPPAVPAASAASAPVEVPAGQGLGAAPPPAAADAAFGKVLQTLTPSAVPGEAHFRLSWPDCRGGGRKRCAYEIAWFPSAGDAQAYSGLPLDWEVPAKARVRPIPWDPSLGAGEPLIAPGAQRPSAWSAGEEEGTVTASARLLALPGTAAPPAVLVDQRAGFEHLKRRHTVYAVVEGKIKKVWSRAEPAGPQVSWVLAPPGRPPVHLSVFLQPDGSGPDKLAAHELVWNGARSLLAERGGASGLMGVVAGTYGSVADAQAARSAACLAEYWVIDTQPLKWTLPQRYALLLPASQRSAASAEVARLKRCRPNVQARAVPLPRLQANPFE